MYFSLKYKTYSLSSICNNMYTSNFLPWWIYIKILWKIHLQKQISSMFWVFTQNISTSLFVFFYCVIILGMNGFYLFLHMNSSESGQLSNPYSPLAASTLSAVGMEVKGGEGQAWEYTQAPSAPGVRHMTDQGRKRLLQSTAGSRERRHGTDGAQHSIFCWRAEAEARGEIVSSLISRLVKSSSNPVSLLTNA